jgi:FAD/FMN-containing dehydrogenase
MTLDDSAITALRATIAGEVLSPTDAGFARARAEVLWNGNIAHQPALITRPTSNEDVAATIAFARTRGLNLSVRGGGHGYAGKAVVENGVVIDLSRLDSVRVDPHARRAYVGGGATWAAVDAATVEHGLAVTGGTISHTGVAGLTLGGGVGWLMSRQGLSCDNLAAATLVTADGRTVTVSEEEHPQLLWGLRGAGSNFGVVTELVFALGEVNPLTNLGLFFWRAEDAAGPLRFARDYLYDLTPEMGALIAGLSAPPEPFVPPELQGAPGFAVLVVSWGSVEDHAAAVEPLRTRGPAFELVTPIPYVALQQMLDPGSPWGVRAYDKSLNFDELPDEAIEVLVSRLPRKSSPLSLVPLFPLRGSVRDIPDDATAFGPPRSRRWVVSMEAVAPDEETLAADRQWARDLWTSLRPYAPDDGAYVNFEYDADEARVRASYGEQKYRRLAALKAEWDPDNVFRSNVNITPERATTGVPSPRDTTDTSVTEPSG